MTPFYLCRACGAVVMWDPKERAYRPADWLVFLTDGGLEFNCRLKLIDNCGCRGPIGE